MGLRPLSRPADGSPLSKGSQGSGMSFPCEGEPRWGAYKERGSLDANKKE